MKTLVRERSSGINGSMSSASLTSLDELRHELQSLTPSRFEHLAAALVGRMIGVGVVVAKSGFQYGGDAGTAGREGRRLRLETKRYSDTTSLGDRELLGELEQATQRDPALELWILAATTGASEQLETSLFLSASKQGVPVLVLDWKAAAPVPTLAALCASSPETVRELGGNRAGALASEIAASGRFGEAAARLGRELAAWNVGYASTAASAREWLDKMWNSPAEAVAALGQDAAGGAEPTLIPRPSVSSSLGAWWSGSQAEVPAVLVGDEGMGKTWACVAWLVRHAETLPIVVALPSGMVASAVASNAGVTQLIAARLHEITQVRDSAFWSARVERMLLRPRDEGPAFLLMLDGMNQETKAPWEAILRILQAGSFAGRVRVIGSTRPLSFETDLRHLNRLVAPAIRIDVGPYDDAVGGEFDQVLALHGLTRSDLREELVSLARVPRLLDLVVRLRERMSDVGRVTVHSLLWEYGRDTLGVRGGRSFDEREWRAWLAAAAERFRSTGSAHLSRGDLEQTAARPSLDPAQIRNRLSDIVDGQFADVDALGGAVMRPGIVAQALGVAIIEHLAATSPTARMTARLDGWLDPIAGLSERSEILRAAVAIGTAPASNVPAEVMGALTAAWLSTQNLPDDHRLDIEALAPAMAGHLLSAVGSLHGQPLAASRDLAIEALRSIPRSDPAARAEVVAATKRWMRTVSREAENRGSRSDDGERARVQRLASRTGSDFDGERSVLGRPLSFVPSTEGHALAFAPSLIEGYPLEPFIDTFELAALQLAIRDRFDTWASLEWLTLWNEVDFAATAAALRTRAEEILARDVEPGVDPRLRQRVRALLLQLTSDPTDEADARAAEPRLGAVYSYEADYEARPATSMFALERRHAELVMGETGVGVGDRMRRLSAHWWDPTLNVTPAFRAEVEQALDSIAAARFAPENIRRADDLDFNMEQLEVAAARCSPGALARFVRRHIATLATLDDGWPRLGEAAYQSLLVGNTDTARILREARDGRPDPGAGDDGTAQLLMQPTLVDLDGEEQVEAILAFRPAALFTNVNPFLQGLDGAAIDRLVASHGRGEPRIVNLLVELTSVMAKSLGDASYRWLRTLASDPGCDRRISAFETLARWRPREFGSSLVEDGWSWDEAGDDHLAHYGSLALMRASLDTPFDQIAPRLAPWLIARAARERGAAPAEVRLAAAILDVIVRASTVELPDEPPELSVDERRRTEEPFAIAVNARPDRGLNEVGRINAAMDEDARERDARRAVAEATAHIRGTRSAGASLYVAPIDPEDLVPILEHASDIVGRWTDGATERTATFKRRVRLAEGFYIALVEASLRSDAPGSAALWRATRGAMTTTFTGAAGIDRMILALLRAPTRERLPSVVESVTSPASASTDEALMQVSVAAAAAGRDDVLAAVSAADRSSGIAWRVERGKTLEAFAPGASAPPGAHDGRGTPTQIRDARRAERRYRDGAARHWWNAYWSAEDGETAFACWTLLRTCVDRRALEWTRRLWPTGPAATPLARRKRIYALRQLDELKRAAEKADKDLGRSLYQRRIVDDVKPWTRLSAVEAG